jgi:FkbM family methyltransferase
MNIQEYEKLNPFAALEHQGRKLVYLIPNSMCLMRAETLFTKEPSTIGWLDSIPTGAVYLDVGANVGMYVVYAGVIRQARVFAFEPEAQNYALLQRNIQANRLGTLAIAWCAALSDTEAFDRIHLSQFLTGGSCHSFGEALDPYLKERKPAFVQGCYATTIDKLVQTGVMPVPHYIKIDVDGFEHKVIKGAADTLQDPAVASLLIEINPALPEHRWIIEYLNGMGFRHDEKQVAEAERKEGYFKGVAEYVFRR